MVRVGFWACGFGSGWAWTTGNFHGFISGCNISSLSHIQSAFVLHLGNLKHKKYNFWIPNTICSKIQKWLIIWERAYIFLNHGSNFLNSGQENITTGYNGPSIMWPGLGHSKAMAHGPNFGSGFCQTQPYQKVLCII